MFCTVCIVRMVKSPLATIVITLVYSKLCNMLKGKYFISWYLLVIMEKSPVSVQTQPVTSTESAPVMVFGDKLPSNMLF